MCQLGNALYTAIQGHKRQLMAYSNACEAAGFAPSNILAHFKTQPEIVAEVVKSQKWEEIDICEECQVAVGSLNP